ncbi:MAG: alpha/beta hydrolase [Bacteroidetes bacterium]|nr:MAG: alpha/beta hydrolase [Bacteroidota bacterium]
MRNIILYLILTTFIFFSPIRTKSQDNSGKRKKIGLVLSGGGAKGIAHVGILKAMEEEGLRPDYIAGTSMGSIIGGLYAMGYSADQLDTIVRAIDWGMVLSNNIPLNYISYEEKEYYNRYLIELPIVDGKLKLPSGMIEGQSLSEVLTHYTWPAMKYHSFDDFPIPFRCIATDVSNGKEIVFKDGPLSEALRASMSIPTAFTAADLDTTLAVDGGVVNNFPVEELFKMGAEVVIGVNVGDGFLPAEEIGSMTGILMQVAMIPSLERISEQIEMCNIYIRPDLKENSTASFSAYAEILELGYIAGEENRNEFKALAEQLSIKSPEKEYEGIPFDPAPIEIGKINLNGNDLVTETLVLSKLGIQVGDTVNREEIEEGVRRVYGINSFKKVIYQIEHSDANEYELTVKMREKPPATLKSSVHYDNLFSAGIVLNLTLRNLLGKSSRTIIAGDISTNPKFRFDYLKYVGAKENIALNFRYDFTNEEIPTYSNGKLEDVQVSNQQTFNLGFITTQSLQHSFYLGAAYQFNKEKARFATLLPEEIKHVNFDLFKINFSYAANQLNDRNYPTKGREILVIGESFLKSQYYAKYENGIDSVIGFTEQELNDLIIKPMTPTIYGKVQVRYFEVIPITPRFQIIPGVSTGITLALDTLKSFDDFRIGGNQLVKITDNRFFGLNFAEVRNQNFLKASLFFQNVLFSNLYLKYGANLLLHHDHVPLNNIGSFDFEDFFVNNSILGYGIQATYKSPLGPVSGGLSRNTIDSNFRFYLAIGFSFNYSD